MPPWKTITRAPCLPSFRWVLPLPRHQRAAGIRCPSVALLGRGAAVALCREKLPGPAMMCFQLGQ